VNGDQLQMYFIYNFTVLMHSHAHSVCPVLAH